MCVCVPGGPRLAQHQAEFDPSSCNAVFCYLHPSVMLPFPNKLTLSDPDKRCLRRTCVRVWPRLVQAVAFPCLTASSCTSLHSRRIRHRTACATKGPMGSLFASVAGLRSFEADLQVALSTELMVRASLACNGRMDGDCKPVVGRAMRDAVVPRMCARALSFARVCYSCS